MHVAMVFPYSVREITGIGTVVKMISRALLSTAVNVTWVVPDRPGPFLVRPDSSLTVHEISVSRYLHLRDVLLALGTFRRLMGVPNLSHVHAHSPHLQSIAALLASRIRGVPCIVTFHGVLPRPRDKTRNRLLSAIEGFILRNADAITTVSAAARNALVHKEAVLIPNGVDIPVVSREEGKTIRREWNCESKVVLLYAGRFAVIKGVDILVRGFEKALPLATRPLHLVLIGSGDPAELDHLRVILKRLELKDSVTLIDATEDYRRFLPGADVYLFPSFREGMPVTVLEAMASGIPVVASRTGGIPEIVRDGVEGHLVEPGDVDGFVQAILALVENPDERKAMGQRARQRIAEDFSQSAMLEKYVKLYEQLAGLPRG